ncbi:MAG: hypothetical protein JWO47_296 [Candidatus Saccharibacteria bacterium]|nr:hypothetical protein [Candidatus Saccharibacteria bacterium]
MMFFASVALYLTVRKSLLIKTPSSLTNLAMFAIPLLVYATMGLSTHQSYSISAPHFLLLVIAAVVFAYGGNTLSLKAIDIAPNPGYSLVLSKSYVLFTTIVAVLFLHADLSWRKAVAILVIVGFSGLIMINKKGAKHVKSNRWMLLSFGSFFAWGSLSLTSKYLFNHGLGTIPWLIYLYAIVTACILVANKMRKSSFRNLSKQRWVLLIGTGIFSTLFNLGQFEAIKVAPNVGYVNAINAGSIALVTVLAVILFKDELTKKKAVGILGVTLGLLLLLV